MDFAFKIMNFVVDGMITVRFSVGFLIFQWDFFRFLTKTRVIAGHERRNLRCDQGRSEFLNFSWFSLAFPLISPWFPLDFPLISASFRLIFGGRPCRFQRHSVSAGACRSARHCRYQYSWRIYSFKIHSCKMYSCKIILHNLSINLYCRILH